MGKKTYLGVDNIARKAKKSYIGIDNVARKVKKVYLGVNDKAQCIFGGELIEAAGFATQLTGTRAMRTAAYSDSYAIFSAAESTVDAYDSSLTKRTLSRSNMLYDTTNLYSNGNYFFAGGKTYLNGTSSDIVEAFDSLLVRHNAPSLTLSRYAMACISIGLYALFVGGLTSTGTASVKHTNKYECYNASLTKTHLNEIPLEFGDSGSAAITQDFAIIIARAYVSSTDSYTNVAYAFNKSITRSDISNSVARAYSGATSIGGKALFAGGGYSGYIHNAPQSTTFAYDNNLTLVSQFSLVRAKSHIGAVTCNKHALLAGGANMVAPYYSYNDLEIFDESLTKVSTELTLSGNRGYIAAAAIGDKCLFGGGYAFNADYTWPASKVVEVFEVNA